MHVFENKEKYTGTNKGSQPSCQPLKNHYKFIKYNPEIKRFTGCDRATLILEKIEFWFKKYPDGFYKFIEPCSHRLYKKHDSWAEELGCDRKCFTRAWDKIGFRHRSRMAFEAAEDKFEGKLYASYYDRHLNQMFFIRNHDLANETLKQFYPPKNQPETKQGQTESDQAPKTCNPLHLEPLGTGHYVRSYTEAKNTPTDLSKDKFHASNEAIKKMVEIWTAIVEEGRGQIKLEGKLIPYLKKALVDQFNNCLQKWKEYCISIARSKFLMGEKKSWNGEENFWKADLMWALKFESIRKVLAGHYGIGDRNRKMTFEELEEQEQQRLEKEKIKILKQKKALEVLEQEINASETEHCLVKEFRIKWLKKFGEQSYRELFSRCLIEVGDEAQTMTLRPECSLVARKMAWMGSKFKNLLEDFPINRIRVYHSCEILGKPYTIDSWFGDAFQGEGDSQADVPTHVVEDEEDLNGDVLSTETQALRVHLRTIIASPPDHFIKDIRFERITSDNELVVSFGDEVAVAWYRCVYQKQIFEAGRTLWDVEGVVIEDRSTVFERECDFEEEQESDEQALIQQAVAALRESCYELDDAILF